MSAIRFKAKLDTINDWAILRLPKEASAKLPSRGQVMVKGSINGFRFKAVLEPDGVGSHWLKVDEAMQKAAKISVGDAVALAVESTKDWPEPEVPADIKKALTADKQAYELWKDVTPMARWEWIRWISSTSNPETRAKRIRVSASKLQNGLRRPCCFNRNMCCVPQVSKGGVLLDPA